MARFLNLNRHNALPVLGFGIRELGRTLVAKLTGAAPLEQQALDWVLEHATEGDPDSVLAAFDDFGRNRRFLMNVGDRKGQILDDVLVSSGARHVLELGAFCGYSAVRTARILAKSGGRLTSIETSPRYAEVARAVVEFAGLGNRVEFIVAAAAEVIPQLDGSFDVVFIDHWKDLYLPDLRRIEDAKLLHPGSVVVADNIGIFDSEAYLDHVRGCGKYDSVHHPSKLEYNDHVDDAVEVSTWRG